MKSVKRLTALLMVLAMLVTNLPLGALAVETEAETEPVQAVQESTADPAQEPAAETADEMTETVLAEATEETVGEPATETTEAATEETTEETLEETLEEPTETVVEETTAEVVEEETAQQDADLSSAVNEPYLAVRWLDNGGDGWYESPDKPIDREDHTSAYGNKWIIPYLMLWNDSLDEYEPFPVKVTSNSKYLYICPLTEYEGGHRIKDGEPNAEYFVLWEGRNTITEQPVQVTCTTADGQTYVFDHGITKRHMGYYSTPYAALESVIWGSTRPAPGAESYEFYFVNQDPSVCEYLSFNVEVDDWGSDYQNTVLGGEELLTWEKVNGSDDVVKLTVNPKFVKFAQESTDWESFQVTVSGKWLENDQWESNFHQQLTIEPAGYDDHYLTVAWLNNDQGWYLNENDMQGSLGSHFGMGTFNRQPIMFFLNSLDKSTGEWTRRPIVPTSTSPYVTITRIKDMPDETPPKSGEEFADYFLWVESHSTLERTKFYLDVDNGSETLHFASMLYPQDFGFYTAPTVSVDTILPYGEYFMNAESGQENAVYLLLNYPDELQFKNLNWQVQAWGNDYEDFAKESVTMEPVSGGYKFILDPEYVKAAAEAAVYDDWMNFEIVIQGDLYEGEKFLYDFDWHVGFQSPEPDEHQTYVSVSFLENMGEGWYLPENAEQYKNVGTRSLDWGWMVFFLNTWNETKQSWDSVPVIPTTDSDYLTISKAKDLNPKEFDNKILEGQKFADYFLQVRAVGTLDYRKEWLAVQHDGITVKAPFNIYGRELAFYTEDRIGLDTIVADYNIELDPNASETVLYLKVNQPRNWTLRDFKMELRTWDSEVGDYVNCEDLFSDVTYGAPLVDVKETVDGNTFKITINQDYVNYVCKHSMVDWRNFSILASGIWYDENGNMVTYWDENGNQQPSDTREECWVNPPESTEPFICAWYLDEQGEGWFVNEEEPPTMDYGTRGLDWRWYIFFLFTWDEEKQEYIPEPIIPYTDSDKVTITRLFDLPADDPHTRQIREGYQHRGDYFVQIRSHGTIDGEHTEMMYYTDDSGKTYELPFNIHPRETGFYTAPERSVENAVGPFNYRLDPKAEENALYYLIDSPEGNTFRYVIMTVDTHGEDLEGMFCDGEDLVTMTQITGGYKLTINPKFVEALAGGYERYGFRILMQGTWYGSNGEMYGTHGEELFVEPPIDTKDPYISAAYLENDGEGWYLPEGREPNRDMGTRAMDWSWMVFYLNIWNPVDNIWEVTPIIPSENSDDLVITKLADLPNPDDSKIWEDQKDGQYFVQVRSFNSLDSQRIQITYALQDSVVKAPFRIHTRDLSFYNSDQISVDSCMPDRQYLINKDPDAEASVYFRTYNTGWTIDDVKFEVISHGYDYHEFTYGNEAVHMVELADGTGYEFIINPDFVEYVRKNYKINWVNLQLRVHGNWYNENGEYEHGFEDECWINPPDDTDPFICAWRLDNQGDGWYVQENTYPTVDYGTRGMDCNWFVFFLFTWDETKGEYVPEPIIPYENSNNLEVNRLVDMTDGEFGDVTIRDDQIRGDYFVQVLSRNSLGGVDETEMMYYTDASGNTFELPVRIHPRETGFYSAATRSPATAIYNGQFQLDSKAVENAIYYLIETPYDHTFENVSFSLNTWDEDYSGMFCDGEDLISWEKITGGYKIIINPKYVQAMSTGTDWCNFSIIAEWDRVSPDGHKDHEKWEEVWVNPPERYDPYLSWGYLEDTKTGWRFNEDSMGGLDHYWTFDMSGMNDRWVVFFLNTYNEATGKWTRTPFVPTITGENIYMYTLPETGNVIDEDAEYTEYYRHIKARGSLGYYEFNIGCDNVPGYEDLTFTGYVIDRQVAFYTTEEPSVHTILHQGYTNLNAEGENVFYISKLHNATELRNFKLEIDTWGEDYTRFCGGEKIVNVEETSRGYKITVNPKYVQYVKEHVHDNWKNFCLFFEVDVHDSATGEKIVTWADLLWVEPPMVSVDLDNIVNSDKTIEQKVEEVQKMDTEDLKSAMENDEKVVEQIQKLEEKTGTNVVVDTKNESPIESGEIIGAGLNKVENKEEDITLVIDKPVEEKPTEEIAEKYDSDVNIQFSMTLDNVQNTEKLDVPVMITLAVPDGVDIDLLVLLHYHGDGVEQVNFSVSKKDGKTYITFALDGFSDFVMTHQKRGDVNRNGTIDVDDAVYVIWHTMFPQVYPLSVNAVDMDNDQKITQADAVELLWKSLDF